MSVRDVTTGNHKAAWLLDYKVDSSALKPEHKEWLDRNVLRPILAEDARNRANGKSSSTGEHYTVWVVGSASRTGSYDYNLRLSERRARVVQRYLAEALEGATPVVTVRTHALSELRAALLGDKDETENMAHRAVYVSLVRHPAEFPPPKPVITPPPAAVAVDFFFCAKRASWFNVTKWFGILYAVYRHKGETHYKAWLASSSGLSVSPEDVLKSITPSLPKTDVIVAGQAEMTFPSAALVERLSRKTIYPRIAGKTFALRIVDGAPDNGDLVLEMPILMGDFQLSQGVGSLGKPFPMTPEAIRNYRDLIQFFVVCGGKLCA